MRNLTHALVILSGGQDSTTCLGWALTHYDVVSCVTFDYGQSHAIELEAAHNVVDFFKRKYDTNIDHQLVVVPQVLMSSSPLLNDGKGLETYDTHKQMEEAVGDRVEKTFVPLRNLFFMVIAANHAVAIGATRLVTRICQEDNANYPDCRLSFARAAENAINEAMGYPPGDEQYIRIETPLMNLTKAQSVLQAVATPFTYAALAYSHTAYDGHYPPTGHDHASILRAHGFEKAMLPDPLVLRAHAENLMPLPNTKNYSADAIALIADRLVGIV